MPIINCPECHHEVSDKAAACPQCGYPINTALVERKETDVAHSTQMSSQDAQQLGQAMANPILEQQQKKSSGGATGALIGAVLGYFLMASSCGMPDTPEGFTMTLFFWSPVIFLGMIMGYFFGMILGRGLDMNDMKIL